MGQLIAITLLGLLALVLILLVAPIRVRLSFGPKMAEVGVRYLMFFSEHNVLERTRRIGVFGRTILRRGPPLPKPPKVEKPKEEKPAVGLRDRGRLLWSFRVLIRRTLLVVVRFIGRLLRSWRLQRADIALIVGLSNPAHTGMATGLFHALRPAMRRRFPRLHLSLHPDFQQPTKRTEGEIVLRIMPVEPVFHLVRAVGTLPWQGLWKLKKAWTP